MDTVPTPPPNQPPRPQGGLLNQIMQSIMFYFVISSALTYFNAKKVTPREHSGEHTGITLEPASELQTLMGVSPGAKIPVFPTRDHEGRKLGPHRCLFKSGALLDFSLYITEDEKFDFSKDSNSLVLNQALIFTFIFVTGLEC
jgi:hypothetical protein